MWNLFYSLFPLQWLQQGDVIDVLEKGEDQDMLSKSQAAISNATNQTETSFLHDQLEIISKADSNTA